jgi:3-dehydroquinate synthase
MPKINLRLIKHTDSSYAIMLQPGIIGGIPADLKKKKWGEKYCIITDTNVKKLYGEELMRNLREVGLDATLLSFPAGESRKNLKTVEKLLNQMIQLGHNRHSCVIALGGGVVGDTAGFVASTFMRGIPFVQVPTTLMAMADSSIGGKTGVDLVSGKNLVGTFTQPKRVYIDPQVLSTLSKKQILNGLAEIVKHGLIVDKGILTILKKEPKKAAEGHTTTITKLLVRSCKVKAKVVQRDTYEKNLRMILNYGHSIGHGIEHASGYRLQHGQAVAIGMNLENRLAVDRKLLKPKECEAIEELIKSLGLPTRIPEKINRDPILKAIKADKKNKGKTFTMTLLKRAGKPVIVDNIKPSEVKAVL